MDAKFIRYYSSLSDDDRDIISYIYNGQGVTLVDIMGGTHLNMRKTNTSLDKLRQYSMLVVMPDNTHHLSRHGRQFWDLAIKEFGGGMENDITAWLLSPAKKIKD